MSTQAPPPGPCRSHEGQETAPYYRREAQESWRNLALKKGCPGKPPGWGKARRVTGLALGQALGPLGEIWLGRVTDAAKKGSGL